MSIWSADDDYASENATKTPRKLQFGMKIEAPTGAPPAVAMEAIILRARALYSLPAVAAEVIELTNCPKVDARALKDCIEVDPALTAKIMRVVNSSLFGMSREVVDLNQAIALLGTTPLKLLVLGFSLPENLFCEVAREQLDWYWKTTLARAVAAREISEQLWNRSGDDAFLVGLLQDIGMLVLLGELKGSYALFLDGVINQRADLQRLEVESLGFEHTALSAALLKHWNMPEVLVQSISEPRDFQLLQGNPAPAAELARILHLAELMADLVAQNRLDALPDLLEAGEAYCGLDKERLHRLVESLQPKVCQLADVLSLDLCEGADYAAIVAEAHAQMSEIAEGVAAPLSRLGGTADQSCESLLADVANLKAAAESFLSVPDSATENGEVTLDRQASTSANSGAKQMQTSVSFIQKLTMAVGLCRSRRQPLSLLLLDVCADRDEEANHADAALERVVSHVLDAAALELAAEGVHGEVMSPSRRAYVLTGHDRQEAVRHAKTLFRFLEETFQELAAAGISGEFATSAGVAAVSLPVKNFPPRDLLESAERCLAAARSTGPSVVKSLEIY